MLIDCDIHVTYRSIKELAPYADPHTRELIERSGVAGLSMPTYPWVHPSGWIRRDTYDAEAVEAGTMFPGFTLEQLRAHVLDPFDVAFALANPDEAACFSVLPNARLAAGLASAYNDWLVENWLRHEPRLRGALVVPAQWPEAAAAEIRRHGAERALRRRVPPGRRAHPVRQPGLRPDLGGRRRGRPARRGARALRGRRHVGAADRRRARPTSTPSSTRSTAPRSRATSSRSSATACSSATRRRS